MKKENVYENRITEANTKQSLYAAVDEVRTQITEAFAPVTDAVMNLITSLGNVEDIESGMAKLWEGIQDIFAPVVRFFAGIWERIKESFGTI